jgi:predicted HAD superfamily Cof-like phosphohydrolase
MKRQLQLVREFHRKIGEVISDEPRLLDHHGESDDGLAQDLRQIIASRRSRSGDHSEVTTRALMAVEELAEWIEAHNEDDLVAAADAWADRMYLLLGDAVASGMPAEPLLDEVHRSNMTKVAANEQTGKGTKASGYQSPNIQTLFALKIKEY